MNLLTKKIVFSLFLVHAFFCFVYFFCLILVEIETKNIRLMFIQNVPFRYFPAVISPFRLTCNTRKQKKRNCEHSHHRCRTSHEINKCAPRCLCVYFCIIPFYDEKFKLDRLRVWNTWNVKENGFCLSSSSYSA